MSIKWFVNGEFEKETHVGLVISDPIEGTERVMSDIYAKTYSVRVFDPTNKCVDTVQIQVCFELSTKYGKSTKDLVGGPYEAQYEQYLIEQEEKARLAKIEAEKYRQQQREREAKEEMLRPRVGSLTRVTNARSRKVAKGTEGVIFWVGDKGYGLTVGFKDAQGNVHWTAASNVSCTCYGLDFGQDPIGMTWLELKEAVEYAERVAHETSVLPQKGMKVRLVADPSKVGKIFWVKGDRVGFKADSKSDPVWSELKEIEYLNGNTWEPLERKQPKYPDFSQGSSNTTTPTNTQAPTQKAVEPKSKPVENPFAGYPEPLCNIRQITKNESGKWVALDGEGTLITVLPEKTALELGELLV